VSDICLVIVMGFPQLAYWASVYTEWWLSTHTHTHTHARACARGTRVLGTQRQPWT